MHKAGLSSLSLLCLRFQRLLFCCSAEEMFLSLWAFGNECSVGLCPGHVGPVCFVALCRHNIFLSRLSQTVFKKYQAGKLQTEVYPQLGTKDLNPSLKSSRGPADPVQRIILCFIIIIFLSIIHWVGPTASVISLYHPKEDTPNILL